MRSYSLRGSFEQPLHHASLVVFQQGEVEAVLVRAAAAAPAFVYRLHLHQRAMGVVEYHKTLRPARDKEGERMLYHAVLYFSSAVYVATMACLKSTLFLSDSLQNTTSCCILGSLESFR